MKKLILLMLVVLGGAVATPLFLSIENGRVRVHPPDLSRLPALPEVPAMPELPAMPALGGDQRQPVAAGGGAGRVQVYKWQDAAGQWHFSSEPPPAGAAAETVELDANANVVQAPREAALPAGREAESSGGDAPRQRAGAVELPSSPYDVQGMIDAAEQARRALEERAEQQRKVLDQL